MRTKVSAACRVNACRVRRAITAVAALWVATALTGCTAILQPIDGIPAKHVPPQLFAEPKNDLVPVDVSLLALEPPRDYQIGPGDILGVYIEGVLPFNAPNAPPQPPPINFPDAQSVLPPSIGYPIPVQEDGTLSLPLLEPLEVENLTLEQVRDAIRDAYIDNDILRPEKARPIVTVIRERTYDVIVIRQDQAGNSGGSGGGEIRGLTDQSATGGLVKLPAYQNDILHALMETGGLPGLTAKNEVIVLRASKADKRKRAQFLRSFYAYRAAVMQDPCACPPVLPDDETVLRIPLRVKPGIIPELTDDDVRLESGDIVYIESRETEVYYTGGLLPGGEFPLPRDYDLDVLGAMALAGQGVYGQMGGANRGGGGLGGGGGMGGGLTTSVPPGRLYILRKTPCNGQIAIEVDLTTAINDPRQRPLIQAGDMLILQHKCEEEAVNFGIATFFTYGISQLLRGQNR